MPTDSTQPGWKSSAVVTESEGSTVDDLAVRWDLELLAGD
jgi:hypothetical protein